MKNDYLFVIVTMVGASLSVSMFAQEHEQKVLVTLQENEFPLYSESCIPMSLAEGKFYLVTNQDGKIFVYDGSKRNGPYKDTQTAGISDCGTQRESICTAAKNFMDDQQKYLRYRDDGKVMFSIGGKEYGPMAQILEIAFSADKETASLVYMDEAWNSYFLTPEGKTIPLEGEFTKLIMSATGKTAIVVTKGTKSPNMQDMEKVAQMSPEEMMKWAQSMGLNDNNPSFNFYLNNGQKLGPFLSGGYTNNPSFCITGGDNWYMQLENCLYINGILVKDFGENSFSLCDVWLSPDGKRFAVFVNYDELIFSDGQAYLYPLQINVSEAQGKIYLNWLSLDDKHKLIYNKKAL